MTLFSKRNLLYTDYTWSNYPPNDARVSGKPDGTSFNKGEGNEVVYLVNKMMTLLDYRFTTSGNKMEKLIHDELPGDFTTQEQVFAWVRGQMGV